MVRVFNYLKAISMVGLARISELRHRILNKLEALLYGPEDVQISDQAIQSTSSGIGKRVEKLGYLIAASILLFCFCCTILRSGLEESCFVPLTLLYFASKKVCGTYFSADISWEKWNLAEVLLVTSSCAFFSPDRPIEHIFLNTICTFVCVSGNSTLKGLVCLYSSLASAYVVSSRVLSLEFLMLAATFFGAWAFILVAHKILTSTYERVLTKFLSEFQRLEQKLNSKTLFVASVTHDLKNPLTAILSAVDLANDCKELGPNERKSLSTAKYSGQVLMFLIGSILDVTKIETGRFDLNLEEFSITEEMRKVMRIENELVKMKSIALYKKTCTPIPPLVIGDAMRITQVLLNLIGNAIKFTSTGYVAVLMRWAKTAQEAKEDFLSKLLADKMIAASSDLLIPPEEYFIIGSTLCVSPQNNKKSTNNIRGRCDSVSMPPNENNSSRLGDQDEELTPQKPESRKELSNLQLRLVNPLTRKISRTRPMILTSSDHIIQMETIQKLELSSSIISLPDNSSELESFIDPEAVFDEKGYLVFDVIDTGLGMTEEEQARLFRPFVQANSSVKSRYGGTGLGLWISKQLIEVMNGEILLRSKQGRGSVFTVTLPLTVSKTEPVSPKKQISLVAAKDKRMSRERVNNQSREMSAIRMRGKALFSTNAEGPKKPAMQVLVLENRMCQDDSKLEQVVNQLKRKDCLLFYATYETAIQLLHQERFDFNAVIVIASSNKGSVKSIYKKILELAKNYPDRKPQIVVAADLVSQTEFTELVGEQVLTFPVRQEGLQSLLSRTQRSARGKSESLELRYHPNLAEEVKHAEQAESVASIQGTEERIKVLLADDDVFSNMAVKNMIERGGKYQVFSVFNGREALERYKEKIDDIMVAILDVEMPYMNGIEAAAEIRREERKKGAHKMPIIGLTGHESLEVKQAAIDAGMSVVLTKPLNFSDVVTVLESATINTSFDQ